MRDLFVIILLFQLSLLMSACSEHKPSNTKNMKPLSNTEKTDPGVDSTTIDTAQFNLDRTYYQSDSEFPIHPGFFPTYVYDSPGNGTVYFETTIAGKKCIGRSSFVYRGDFNDQLFEGEDESMIVFTVIVPTSVKAANDCFVSSRNHPNYIAQGKIQTETQPIDWLSIQPFEGTPSAIINTKYFDLSKGKVVLVYPQEDHSLRFYQVATPFLSAETIEQYVKDQSLTQEWIDFYSKDHSL